MKREGLFVCNESREEGQANLSQLMFCLILDNIIQNVYFKCVSNFMKKEIIIMYLARKLPVCFV